jgi:hypothetical protein
MAIPKLLCPALNRAANNKGIYSASIERLQAGAGNDHAPVRALFPSSRHLPSRVRLFIDTMADWLNKRASAYVASSDALKGLPIRAASVRGVSARDDIPTLQSDASTSIHVTCSRAELTRDIPPRIIDAF